MHKHVSKSVVGGGGVVGGAGDRRKGVEDELESREEGRKPSKMGLKTQRDKSMRHVVSSKVFRIECETNTAIDLEEDYSQFLVRLKSTDPNLLIEGHPNLFPFINGTMFVHTGHPEVMGHFGCVVGFQKAQKTFLVLLFLKQEEGGDDQGLGNTLYLLKTNQLAKYVPMDAPGEGIITVEDDEFFGERLRKERETASEATYLAISRIPKGEDEKAQIAEQFEREEKLIEAQIELRAEENKEANILAKEFVRTVAQPEPRSFLDEKAKHLESLRIIQMVRLRLIARLTDIFIAGPQYSEVVMSLLRSLGRCTPERLPAFEAYMERKIVALLHEHKEAEEKQFGIFQDPSQEEMSYDISTDMRKAIEESDPNKLAARVWHLYGKHEDPVECFCIYCHVEHCEFHLENPKFSEECPMKKNSDSCVKCLAKPIRKTGQG